MYLTHARRDTPVVVFGVMVTEDSGISLNSHPRHIHASWKGFFRGERECLSTYWPRSRTAPGSSCWSSCPYGKRCSSSRHSRVLCTDSRRYIVSRGWIRQKDSLGSDMNWTTWRGWRGTQKVSAFVGPSLNEDTPHVGSKSVYGNNYPPGIIHTDSSVVHLSKKTYSWRSLFNFAAGSAGESPDTSRCRQIRGSYRKLVSTTVPWARIFCTMSHGSTLKNPMKNIALRLKWTTRILFPAEPNGMSPIIPANPMKEIRQRQSKS